MRLVPSGEFQVRKDGATVPDMAVIGMDATDRATRRVPRQRGAFQRRNAVVSLRVGNEKQPTEFGYHLLRLMSEAGVRAADIARSANISGSTLTRYIYGGSKKPDSDTLGRIAQALVRAQVAHGVDVGDFPDAVENRHNDLLYAAGQRIGVAVDVAPMHPFAVELNQMIGEGTPLSGEDVRFIETMFDRLVAPYRTKIRKRSG